jgi:hypothetical protein
MSVTVWNGGKRSKAALSAVAVVSILGVIGGCGGGTTTTGPALPRPTYVAQANAICAQAARKIQDGAGSVFRDPNHSGAQDFGLVETYAKTVVLPALQQEFAQLSALKPTSDTNPGDTLSALENAIDGWEMDKAIMATVNDMTFAHFDKLATDFGITTCAATDGIVRSITTGEPHST